VGARFPFASYPRGWFVVAFSTDVAAGEVKTVHYFGQDIVLFRTVSGKLAAIDRTCPHLGAHLGVGRVDGECLRCPFHDWAFDGTGRCVEVPYAPKIPPMASVSAWPVREVNGVVMVFHCPNGAAPTWEPPTLEEEGWTANRTVRWEIKSHPQEVAENTVDSAHLKPVHHAISAEVLSVEQDGHYMHVMWHMIATGAAVQMPDEVNDVELDVTLHGLGLVVSTTHVMTSNLRTRQRIYPTPIDDERIAIFGVNNTVAMPDPEYTREIDEIFYQAFITDFPRDFPIWETKAYLDKPMLVGGDGPIGRYRKWTRQFYEARTEPAVDREQVNEKRGAVVRLTEWLRRVAKPGIDAAAEDPAPGPKKPTLHSRPAQSVRFPSVEAYFATLAARFDRTAAGDLEAVFQWVLTGDQTLAHFAEIKDGTIQLVSGTHEKPTVTIEMSAADYLLMINGELNGARAFSTGRGKLRGPVRLAMKMQRLFPLDRVVH
jgi:nitrite reductase/ring-hydroxylating ferredoxin subunit/putative sterol carrier protein